MKKLGREFLQSRAFRIGVLGCLIVSTMVCTAFAEELGSSASSIDGAAITAAFTSGFNDMVINSVTMISAMVPIALTLGGTLFLVRKAMNWFKAMAK